MDDKEDNARLLADFKQAVNMTPKRLTQWLATPESRAVGWADAAHAESVGHRSGRRIVDLLGKKHDELTAADLRHMRKVVGFVHRHLAQRPDGNIEETPWRYSLMNWGHDPLKRGAARRRASSRAVASPA